ncbi:MAG: hypothetical protein ACD_45C00365G0012 [uncultured bacterium]|nr:MAG: hypothetical protein ACD_45C00365G0012 [uncultured bacterium]
MAQTRFFLLKDGIISGVCDDSTALALYDQVNAKAKERAEEKEKKDYAADEIAEQLEILLFNELQDQYLLDDATYKKINDLITQWNPKPPSENQEDKIKDNHKFGQIQQVMMGLLPKIKKQQLQELESLISQDNNEALINQLNQQTDDARINDFIIAKQYFEHKHLLESHLLESQFLEEINRARPNVPIHELPLLTELTLRTAYHLEHPEHENNNQRGLEVAQHVMNRPWGKSSGCIALTLFVGAALLIAAVSLAVVTGGLGTLSFPIITHFIAGLVAKVTTLLGTTALIAKSVVTTGAIVAIGAPGVVLTAKGISKAAEPSKGKCLGNKVNRLFKPENEHPVASPEPNGEGDQLVPKSP